MEDNLDNLANEFLKEETYKNGHTKSQQIAINKKNSEIMRAKIAAGNFVNGNQKFTEEIVYKFLDNIFGWLQEHPESVFLEEYYLDPETDKTVPFGSLRNLYNKWESCEEVRTAIKKILEIRLVKAALTGKYKENMTKFLLINNYDYKDKTEQDIVLSTKEIKFKFGNPELNEPKTEDGEEI